MVESLVITLREGLEAALVIGIILAYLARTGRTRLNTYVYNGLVLAVLASIAGAVVFHAIGFDPENEVLEGTMLLTAAVFVGSMVIWMWRTAKNLRQEMETKIDQIVETRQVGTGQGIGILLFTFFMVFREGIETVLFMAALSGETSPVLKYVGAIAGLGLAALFAVFFIRGSLQINLQRFFKVTGLILLVLVFRLFAGSLHEFGEVGIIPINPVVMKVIGYIVRDSGSEIISMMLLTLPIIMVLLDVRNKPSVQLDAIKDSVERRKVLAQLNRTRAWKYSVVASAVVINLILGANLVAAMTRQVYDPTPVPVEAKDGKVRVPIAELRDNILQKFYLNVDGTKVRFMVLKRNDGTFGTGLDACLICGNPGYFQEDGDTLNIICKNCNAPIPIPTVGMPGGCNPVALKAEAKGGEVVLDAADLEKDATIFKY